MKKQKILFFLAMLCSGLGGGLLAASHGWLSVLFFALATILLMFKWCSVESGEKETVK